MFKLLNSGIYKDLAISYI